jgi:DNA polymerase-1
MKHFLIFDANSLIYRAYHALPPLTSPDGAPVGAIYGLANILLRLWRTSKPDYAAAMFDRKEPTFRDELYKEYKAHRPPIPPDLAPQIETARELFALFGIKSFDLLGFEADDLIGTLISKFKKEKGVQFIILTGDADELQLVEDDRVVVEMFKKGVSELATFNEEAVKERYGIAPKQFADYKGLVGDNSDNIPGVRGIGPKTARELLQKYGSIEEIYKDISPETLGFSKLEGKKEEALLSKKLATIRRDVPIAFGNLEDFAVGMLNEDAIITTFKRLGFESILKRLTASQARFRDVSLDEKNLLFFEAAPLAFSDEELLSQKIKIGFDLKEILKELWRCGRDISPPYADLGVGFWLLDSNLKDYRPETIGRRFFRESWSGTAEELRRAYGFLKEELQANGLMRIFEELEMPLLRVLAQMERCGVKVDRVRLRALRLELDRELTELIRKIYGVAGQAVNLNSPKQLSKLLFEKLGLEAKGIRKTKSGSKTTDIEALEMLRGAHPIVDLLIRYREIFKIKSTYVLPIENLLDENDRLHTIFIQTGTATGRLSSREPNLQNIPQETAWAKKLRASFVAEKGFSFVAFDYSQMELRVLADVSLDPLLCEVFREGEDVHRLTASKVFKKRREEVTPQERRLAKTLNFGIIFGMGADAFSKAAGITRSEAEELIREYFETFSGVRAWQDEIKKQVRILGMVQTKTGRRRVFDLQKSLLPHQWAEMERMAINMPIQGYEADILKQAMLNIYNELEKRGVWNKEARLLLTIHDELLFEIADDIKEDIIPTIRGQMEKAAKLAVPLVVEVKSGPSWGELN